MHEDPENPRVQMHDQESNETSNTLDSSSDSSRLPVAGAASARETAEPVHGGSSSSHGCHTVWGNVHNFNRELSDASSASSNPHTAVTQDLLQDTTWVECSSGSSTDLRPEELCAGDTYQPGSASAAYPPTADASPCHLASSAAASADDPPHAEAASSHLAVEQDIFAQHDPSPADAQGLNEADAGVMLAEAWASWLSEDEELSEDEGQASSANPADPEEVRKWELHLTGRCQACIYMSRKGKCKKGKDCDFCHLPHDVEPIFRPCKAKRTQYKRSADYLDEIARRSVAEFYRTAESWLKQGGYLGMVVRSKLKSMNYVVRDGPNGEVYIDVPDSDEQSGQASSSSSSKHIVSL